MSRTKTPTKRAKPPGKGVVSPMGNMPEDKRVEWNAYQRKRNRMTISMIIEDEAVRDGIALAAELDGRRSINNWLNCYCLDMIVQIANSQLIKHGRRPIPKQTGPR